MGRIVVEFVVASNRDVLNAGPTDRFVASLEAVKADCRPKLAEDISSMMQIVGIEPDTGGSVLVYFGGAPGRLFMARYDGQWARL